MNTTVTWSRTNYSDWDWLRWRISHWRRIKDKNDPHNKWRFTIRCLVQAVFSLLVFNQFHLTRMMVSPNTWIVLIEMTFDPVDGEVKIYNNKKALSSVSLACLEMSFVVKGAGAVMLLLRLEYKTKVICHNVNTQNVKIAWRDWICFTPVWNLWRPFACWYCSSKENSF